jgi:hypothetical protein
VIAAIAQPTFVGREHQERRGQPPTLLIGPDVLGLIEHRDLAGIVELKERRPIRPTQIERDGDHDAAEPRNESGRLFEIAKATKRPQECFLRGVFRHSRVAHHALCGGIRHPLRCGHESTERVQIA